MYARFSAHCAYRRVYSDSCAESEAGVESEAGAEPEAALNLRRVLHQHCRRRSKPSPNEPIPKWSPTRIELILVGNALIRALFQPILRGAHADWPAGWLGGRLAGWMAGWLAAGTPFYV